MIWVIAFVLLLAAATSAGLCVAMWRTLIASDRQWILRILAGGREMTGLQIMEASDDVLTARIYGTLRSMEHQGLLVSRVDYMCIEARNGRPRIYYKRAEL